MMYSLIYKFYFYLRRRQKKYVEQSNARRKLIQRFIRFIIGYIEAYYNLFVVSTWEKHPSNKIGINELQRKEKIIVSLTSFPKRIDTLWITIESILRQSVKPDKVILWLADNQFNGLESLPQSLLNLQKRGLTIRFCDDLRSHKKYFYTMQEYPEDLVILMDDDMIYPFDTIKKLMDMHRKYPTDICTITGEVMINDVPPSKWRNPYLSEKIEHSDIIQAYTGSGSLFPPNVLSKEVFNKSSIYELCPYADDLWLLYMAHKINTKVTSLYPWRAFPITIYGTDQECLWIINGLNQKNDIQWEKIKKAYD